MTDKEAEGFIKSNLIYIILLVVVFLLGLSITGWQWWQTSSELKLTNKKQAETKIKLEREEIKGFIASAIVEDQRGESELALKDLSSFFTNLQSEFDAENDSAFIADEKEKLKSILSERDQTIALIAKGDKDSNKNLTNIYLKYRSATGDSRQSLGNKSVEDENLDNSNTANQNTKVGETEKQESKNENSANSNVNEENNENSNVVNSQTNSGDVKRNKANVNKEDLANSNVSSDINE